jgi:hypothetical protein
VQRVALRTSPYQATVWTNEPDRRFSAVPLRGFADKKPADALCKELEQQARETTPVGLFLSSLIPENVKKIVTAAKGAGLSPPDLSKVGPAVGPTRERGYVSYGSEYFDYSERVEEAIQKWWATIAPDVTPEINAKLWAKLFPTHQFYTVGRVLVEE